MKKDITNQKFGTLTALYPLQERKHKCIVWQCKCDCGKCIKVNSTDLLRHRRTTCGDGEHRKTVVIGERRGHLTLLRDTGRRDSKGERVYEWRCDCGIVFCRNLIGTLRTGTPHLCPECQKRIKAAQAAEAKGKDRQRSSHRAFQSSPAEHPEWRADEEEHIRRPRRVLA